MTIVEVVERAGPIILAQPHVGTEIPADIRTRLNETGLAIADTDWHVDRLYDGLMDDATIVRARLSRYVIDLNRDPKGVSLYPGQATTALCPLTDFDGNPIYRDDADPDANEIEARIEAFHAPYHAALSEQIARAKARHGTVLLYDCHSIRSEIPRLFDGVLPIFNIGTFDGESCAPALAENALSVCEAARPNKAMLNGRFKGGWATRRYGHPAGGVHAIQMELAQRAYMHESPPWTYDEARAGALRKILAEVLQTLCHRLSTL